MAPPGRGETYAGPTGRKRGGRPDESAASSVLASAIAPPGMGTAACPYGLRCGVCCAGRGSRHRAGHRRCTSFTCFRHPLRNRGRQRNQRLLTAVEKSNHTYYWELLVLPAFECESHCAPWGVTVNWSGLALTGYFGATVSASVGACGAECARTAPSVRVRRRLCRQGGPIVDIPALYAHSKPLLHTRYGSMCTDQNAGRDKRLERRCGHRGAKRGVPARPRKHSQTSSGHPSSVVCRVSD